METVSIKEALVGTVNFPLPPARIITALINAELDGDADYSKGDEQSVDLCMAGLLLTLATSGNITEGGFKREMPNADALRGLRKDILAKWGIIEVVPDVIPTIESGSGLW